MDIKIRNQNYSRKIITLVCGAVILLALSGFAASRLFSLITGPIINIESPSNWENVKTPSVLFTGTIRHASIVTINDRRIYLSPAGDFKERLPLPRGFSIITVRAEDRYGSRASKQIELVAEYPLISS